MLKSATATTTNTTRNGANVIVLDSDDKCHNDSDDEDTETYIDLTGEPILPLESLYSIETKTVYNNDDENHDYTNEHPLVMYFFIHEEVASMGLYILQTEWNRFCSNGWNRSLPFTVQYSMRKINLGRIQSSSSSSSLQWDDYHYEYEPSTIEDLLEYSNTQITMLESDVATMDFKLTLNEYIVMKSNVFERSMNVNGMYHYQSRVNRLNKEGIKAR